MTPCIVGHVHDLDELWLRLCAFECEINKGLVRASKLQMLLRLIYTSQMCIAIHSESVHQQCEVSCSTWRKRRVWITDSGRFTDNIEACGCWRCQSRRQRGYPLPAQETQPHADVEGCHSHRCCLCEPSTASTAAWYPWN